MSALPRLTLQEAITGILDPRGKTIVDVGCGDGAVTRLLTRLGASVIGIEISEEQLLRARKAKHAGSERYEVGRGEALPLGNDSADAVLFSNSFHHLPLDAMAEALAEAARVLKPGGALLVIEPVAAGDYFEAMRAIEDETEIRAAALRALQSPPASLAPDGELTYETVVRFRDADQFIERLVAVDPARREKLPAVEGDLRHCFAKIGHQDADGVFFIARMRRNFFHRV